MLLPEMTQQRPREIETRKHCAIGSWSDIASADCTRQAQHHPEYKKDSTTKNERMTSEAFSSSASVSPDAVSSGSVNAVRQRG